GLQPRPRARFPPRAGRPREGLPPRARSRRVRRAAAALLLITALAGSPFAERVVLPNGMVLLVSERRALPIVAVSVYVRAGSVLDPPDSGGLANLTASLLTRGTAQRSGADIDRA